MKEQRDNPYVGPRTFEEEDRDYFFGRDEEAQQLRALVAGHREALFFATSGAGKSSLVNTRLLPFLRREGFTTLYGRVSIGRPHDDRLQIRNVFVFNLLTHLSPDVDPAELSQLTLAEYLRRYQKLPEPDDDVLVDPAHILIVDQFEELFTTNQAQWEQREDFFRQMAAALEDDPLLWILLVMREDYVTGLERYAYLLPNRLRVRYYMERMRDDAAFEAICAPAAKKGRPFQKEAADALLNDLQQVRVSGASDTVRGEYVEPVQLQLVCYSLWEALHDQPGDTITAGDISTVADVDVTLGQYYEDAVAQIVAATGVAEQKLRDLFDTHLITEKDTRGLVFRGDAETAGVANDVVDYLDDNFFLLRSSTIAGGKWYELVHDRFIPAIRRSNEAARARLETDRMRRAYEARRKQESEARRRRFFQVVLPVAALIGIAVLLLLLWQNMNLQAAVAAESTAVAAAESALGVALDAEKQAVDSRQTAEAASTAANESLSTAEAAGTSAALALENEVAAGGAAIANLQTAQAASTAAAGDAATASALAAERSALLEQQRQSLVSQATRLAALQATATPEFAAEDDADSGESEPQPQPQVPFVSYEQALVDQLAAVEATQTAIAVADEEVAARATPTPTPIPRQSLVGTSVQGQEITAVRFGSGPNVVLLVGGIHAGASPNSVELGGELADWFDDNARRIPDSLTVFIVDNLNPDSEYAPGRLEGRYNANGVDLNRNWDCDWSPDPEIRGVRRAGAGGSAAFSEPETTALSQFILRRRPVAVIFWGAAATGGLAVPGGCPGVNEDAETLARAFAEGAGYNYSSQLFNDVPGDATNWLDRQGIPGFFVLLPDVWRSDFENNLDGVRAVLALIDESS